MSKIFIHSLCDLCFLRIEYGFIDICKSNRMRIIAKLQSSKAPSCINRQIIENKNNLLLNLNKYLLLYFSKHWINIHIIFLLNKNN